MEGQLGLRERKKAATREALHHAAVSLYRQRGPEAVTCEDICEAAGVSPRTFFNYFATKDEAVLSVDIPAATLRQRIIERPAEESPFTAIRAMFTERLAEMMETPSWQELILLLHEHPELMPRMAHTNRAFEAAVAEAVAVRTGRDVADVYVRVTAATSATAYRTAISCWRPDDPASPDLPTLMRQGMDVLERGLRPD
jgi:AcrR family transcriptional regulator